MLVEFAFDGQNTDILYIMPYDYNIRSIRMIERAGFQLEEKKPVPDSKKAKYELLYKMTRDEYKKIEEQQGV